MFTLGDFLTAIMVMVLLAFSLIAIDSLITVEVHGKVYNHNGKYLGDYFKDDSSCVWVDNNNSLSKVCGNLIVKYDNIKRK